MPLISFSVFREKIISGEKRQTIRAERKYPIRSGDRLYLWWKSRTKEREFLCETVCTEVIPIWICPHWVKLGQLYLNRQEIYQLALQDGFESSKEFLEFFQHEPNCVNFKGILIKWESKKSENTLNG
jgi:uncharacterized protein YqfB (UPF0267 family)